MSLFCTENEKVNGKKDSELFLASHKLKHKQKRAGEYIVLLGILTGGDSGFVDTCMQEYSSDS